RFRPPAWLGPKFACQTGSWPLTKTDPASTGVEARTVPISSGSQDRERVCEIQVQLERFRISKPPLLPIRFDPPREATRSRSDAEPHARSALRPPRVVLSDEPPRAIRSISDHF